MKNRGRKKAEGRCFCAFGARGRVSGVYSLVLSVVYRCFWHPVLWKDAQRSNSHPCAKGENLRDGGERSCAAVVASASGSTFGQDLLVWT